MRAHLPTEFMKVPYNAFSYFTQLCENNIIK